MMFIMQLGWYLFSPEGRAYMFSKPVRGVTWRTALWCRLRYHPEGLIWINMCGLEPEMRCRNCGDDLG